MRISDWSSDVCSSDLRCRKARRGGARKARSRAREDRWTGGGARRLAAVRRDARRSARRREGRAARSPGEHRSRRARAARGARCALRAQAVAGGRDMSDLFDKLENRRAIIDRRALSARLDELAGETSDTGKRRRATVDLLKEALEPGRAELALRTLARPPPGGAAANERRGATRRETGSTNVCAAAGAGLQK